MAKVYICDLCDEEVSEFMAGHLDLRGLDPNRRRPGFRGRRGGVLRFHRHMDLCPTCAQGVLRALDGLLEARDERNEGEFAECLQTC